MKNDKNIRRQRRKYKVRAQLHGTAECPRLSVYRSNVKLSAQLIDDDKGATLASVNSDKCTVESAEKAGEELAKVAKTKKLSKCVFDRNGFIYHGRVKSLADGARKGGLKF